MVLQGAHNNRAFAKASTLPDMTENFARYECTFSGGVWHSTMRTAAVLDFIPADVRES